jgi:hypothetical protein
MDIYDRQRHYTDQSVKLMKLCSVPDRTTSEDLRQASTSLHQASSDIKELMDAQPRGCTCRRHEDDGRSWVTYDEKCQHHRWMLSEIKRVEAHYKALEAKLEDKLRVSLFHAAIQGLLAGKGSDAPSAKVCADRAMEIAVAAVARLRE